MKAECSYSGHRSALIPEYTECTAGVAVHRLGTCYGGCQGSPDAARAAERAQLCLLIFSAFGLHFPSAMQNSIHL